MIVRLIKPRNFTVKWKAPCDEFRICGVVGNSVDRSGFEVFCMSSFISPLFGIVVVLALPEMRPERIEQA
jgi:hypothetical protein